MDKHDISILINTLEQMAAHAEEKGEDCITIRLNVDEIAEVCKALGRAEKNVESPFYDTITGMTSEDYKERFKAEYAQTKIRYEKLKAFNNRIEAAKRTLHTESPFAPTMPPHDCPDDLLHQQQSVMGEYLHLLEVRAVIEGIVL